MAVIFQFLWLTMSLYVNRAVVAMYMLRCSELLPFFCSPEKYPCLQSQEIQIFPNPCHPAVKGWDEVWKGEQRGHNLSKIKACSCHPGAASTAVTEGLGVAGLQDQVVVYYSSWLKILSGQTMRKVINTSAERACFTAAARMIILKFK